MVSVYNTVTSGGLSKAAIEKIVSSVLVLLKKPGDVSVHCIGDARMRRLNREYRKKDKTTDVLAFASQEGIVSPVIEEPEWGDIFLSIPQIRRQAKEHGISYKEEFARMLVHGTLHLLGYDHEEEKDATVMFSLQEKFVKTFI